MNKIILTALLLCTGFSVAGCEKTYSVEEFKKDRKLLDEWAIKCMISGDLDSTNCKNADKAFREIQKKEWPGAGVHDDEQKTEEKKENN